MYEQEALIFKALADETRLRILHLLTEEERCACRIQEVFGCSQPTISYHMRLLTEAGLVIARREGAMMCYRTAPDLWPLVEAMLQAAGKGAEA